MSTLPWYEYESMPIVYRCATHSIPHLSVPCPICLMYPFPLHHDHLPDIMVPQIKAPRPMAPQRRPSTRYHALSTLNSYQHFPSSGSSTSKPSATKEAKSAGDRETGRKLASTKSKHAKSHEVAASSASSRGVMSCGMPLPRFFSSSSSSFSRLVAGRRDQRVCVSPGYRELDFSSWETYSETAEEFYLYA